MRPEAGNGDYSQLFIIPELLGLSLFCSIISENCLYKKKGYI